MSDATDPPADPDVETGRSSERFKAFCDAVIAIAMTLLILPLMESVSEAGSKDLTTLEFVQEHLQQLTSFLLSFVLIALFWVMHHGLYAGVERVTRRLVTLNLAWLAAIVWLPVATAMLGQMASDPLQAVAYTGTLVLASVLLIAMRVYLLRHPALTTEPRQEMVRELAANIALALCFAVTLVAGVVWPGYGNYGFFSCFLIGPLARLFYPMLAPRFHVPSAYPRGRG